MDIQGLCMTSPASHRMWPLGQLVPSHQWQHLGERARPGSTMELVLGVAVGGGVGG